MLYNHAWQVNILTFDTNFLTIPSILFISFIRSGVASGVKPISVSMEEDRLHPSQVNSSSQVSHMETNNHSEKIHAEPRRSCRLHTEKPWPGNQTPRPSCCKVTVQTTETLCHPIVFNFLLLHLTCPTNDIFSLDRCIPDTGKI